MSGFPRRTDRTYWLNHEPITDAHEAIEVLRTTGTTLRETHVARRSEADGGGYEIWVPWVHEGSSGGDTSGTSYYQIDAKLVETMIAEDLLTPYIEKGWGWSRPRPNELVITDKARGQLSIFLKEMEKTATSMLTPGIHFRTGGTPELYDSGRDGHGCGKLYFEYELPEGRGRVMVYPQELRLVQSKGAEAA